MSAQQDWLLSVDCGGALQCAINLAGPVNPADLRDALEGVLARHEVLRTTFPTAAGVRGRTQVIRDTADLDWRVEHGPVAVDGGDTLGGLLERARATDLDLAQGPLVRALLVSPRQAHAVLILTTHRACADAHSLTMIAAALRGAHTGHPEPEEPVQYADYAEWRHEQLTDKEDPGASGRTFWRTQLEQAPVPPRVLFSTGKPSSGPARTIPVPLTAAHIERIGGAASAGRGRLAHLLEACWHATIARVTGAGELMVASWCDGRTQPDLAGAIGPYAQPVPVFSRYGERTTFAEVVDQVDRGRVEAAAQADYAAAGDLARISGAAVAAFHAVELPGLPLHGCGVDRLTPPGGALGLSCLIGADGLRAEIWHDPEVVDVPDAELLASSLAVLARAAGDDTSVRVAQLPLLAADEQDELLAACEGQPPAALANVPVHHRFEQLAQAHPSAVAVASANDQMSYGEMNAEANRVAHLLRAAGVGAGSSVGLCVERTPALIVGLLGILKAGGAYVPLNPEHPPARISHQLTESGAVALVTEDAMLGRLPAVPPEIVSLDQERDRIAEFSAEDPVPLAGPDDAAYIMYTSGSTGMPRGVAVTHRNLSNYADSMAERLIGTGDRAGGLGMRFGVVSAISTDLGNTCIFPALVSGACVQLISTTAARDGALIAGELAGKRFDVLKITPSHLRALIGGDNAGEVLPVLVLVLGGEALNWELVAQVRALSPDLRILNHYGPTETTIGCCAYDVEAPRADSATVPLGWPLEGMRAYVLDSARAPTPAGVPGELCVAGIGVSKGYVGEADESAFVPALAGGGRMYLTGDRVRRLRDGAIEFLGRIDDQVKVRGFRVEPGEIETVLRRHGDIRQAAVVAEADERGDVRLVAYVSAAARPAADVLRAFLAESLPPYMIPSAFVMLDSLPFTPSGKIDRQALSALGAAGVAPEGQHVAPRDPIEREIAAIWRELLGVERVGVHDDFFALGGHSLLATQAIMRIRKRHGDIPLRALLAAPTVAALAEAVRESTRSNTTNTPDHTGSALNLREP